VDIDYLLLDKVVWLPPARGAVEPDSNMERLFAYTPAICESLDIKQSDVRQRQILIDMNPWSKNPATSDK
jgi:hypothetical protein